MPVIRPLALCAMLVASFVAQAQMPSIGAQRNPTFKPGGPDDLWDVTMKMEIAGMPMQMPEQTTQVCTRKGHKDSDLVPSNDQSARVAPRSSHAATRPPIESTNHR